MTNFLIKLFIKNCDDVKNVGVRECYGKFAGIVGIITNVLLALLKIIVGFISSSIAIIADGVNNFTDASSSVITLVGFKLAGMPEDDEHPYGHARIEYLTGVFISIAIIIVGVLLLISSINKIRNPEELTFSITTIVILIVAIFVKFWQMSFYKTIGKKINSIALIATGTDSRNDVIATSAVLLSVIIGKVSGINVDGWFGCVVALFIIWSGIQLIRETSSPLLGEAPDDDLVKAIYQIAQSYDGVLGVHDLVVHNYGPGKVFASIHVEVDSQADIMESHDMIDRMEKHIKSALHVECTAHMDPVKVNDPLVKQMSQVINSIVEKLEGVGNMHDLRVVPGNTHTNIIFDIVLDRGCKLSKKDIHQLIEKEVKSVDPKFFVVITYDQGYTKTVDEESEEN